METETEIKWNGKIEKVVLKSITYGEKNEIIRQSNKIRIVGKQTIVEPDLTLFQELLILKSLKTVPFKISIDNVRALSTTDGEKLYNIANELMTGQTEKKTNSEESLEAEN